jgi:hypothetical protein
MHKLCLAPSDGGVSRDRVARNALARESRLAGLAGRWCVNHRLREGSMSSTVLVDVAGRRRSPATLPAFHTGRPPHNKGLRYPADPPTVEEIIASCTLLATTPKAPDSAAWSSCSGAPAYG